MRKDLEEYLTTLQKQYNEMEKAAAEAQDLLSKGEMAPETAQMIQTYMNTIATNYKRVLYCRHLVNLPPKWIQKIQNKKVINEMKKLKEEHHDAESVEQETQENLDAIKKELPEENDETHRNQTI